MLVLKAAVHFVAPEYLERFAIQDENARRTIGPVSAAAPQRGYVDALRTAMDGVRPGIAGLAEDLLGLDDLVDPGLGRLGLGIDNVDPGRADARNDEKAALQERVAGKRGERGRTGIPSEMVELIAFIRHDDRVDDLAVATGCGIDIDDRKAIRLRKVRAEHERVGEAFARRLHGEFGGGMKGRIWSDGHDLIPMKDGSFELQTGS